MQYENIKEKKKKILKLTRIETNSNPCRTQTPLLPADSRDSEHTVSPKLIFSIMNPFVPKMILIPIMNSRASPYCSNGRFDRVHLPHKSWFLLFPS